MAIKKTKKPSAPKKLAISTPENSPMGKFHKAMQKIVSVPKSKIKDK
jgi:hypothetical protein